MNSLTQSFRHAVRRLLRARAFVVAAVLTLTLGIGATTAVFSIVNGVLLEPLPYAQPSQLVDLAHSLEISGISWVDQSDATYLYYRRENRVFTDIGAYRAAAVNLGPTSGSGVGEPSQSERVTAGRMSAGTFGVLRVAPMRGRAFAERDDRPGAAPVVVIGQRLWERKYGTDPAIVGQHIEIDGVQHAVVGVMPARFRFPAAGTELWVPLGIDPANTKTAAFDYRAVGRLRDGISPELAAADLQRLLPRVPEAFPGRLTTASIEQIRMRAVVRPLRDVVVGDIGRALWVVLAAVGFVLLVACANVANLFLVRAEGRQNELAVRRALGAGRRAIAVELLSEALILAALGGVLGVALAAGGMQVLRSLEAGIDVPRLAEVEIDGTVLAVAFTITLLAALLVTGLPAVRSAALPVSAVLGQTSRTATAGRTRNRARHALVVAQVALALVLLAGAGLMARSFARLRSVKPGFDAAPALTFRLALPDAGYPQSADVARFIIRTLGELETLPGVQATGTVTKLPLDAEARRDTLLLVEDRPLRQGDMPNIHQAAYASPGYFRALGIPLVDGRTFASPDPARAPREVVLSRALAARYWSDGRAVGKRVRMNPTSPWYTVVGVAGDVRGTALEQPPDETIYLPLVTTPRDVEGDPEGGAAPGSRWTPREVAFVVRSAGDPSIIVAGVESAVRALDPAVAVYRNRTMTDVVAQASARTAFTLLLLGIASAVALALGAVGIYGVISYVVSLRSREIAVRLALGAQPADVRRMVSRQAIAVASIGVVLGIAGAIGMTRVLATLLFEVSPTDPAALAGAAALLLAVAAAASWLPARRAAAVEPAQALRAE